MQCSDLSAVQHPSEAGAIKLPVLGPPEDAQISAQINALICASKKVIITGHERPDGDCIGSEVALCAILREAGHQVEVVNADPVPPRYQFLNEGMVRAAGPGENLDAALVVVLDATDLKRLGRLKRECFASASIIDIDHHLGNPNFGSLNWVDTKAAATGELIFRLAACCGWNVPKLALPALYTALVSDTGQFAYSNTSPRVLRMASVLLELGVQPDDIWQRLYLNKTQAEMALESRARASLECAVGGKICSIAISKRDFLDTGTGPQNTEDFVGIARSLAGVELAVFFYEIEQGARTKVSFRSTRALDVNALARKFNGGGHRQAAGCTVDAGLAEAKKMVMKESENLFAAQLGDQARHQGGQ